MAKTDPQLRIRLPPVMKEFIAAQARENFSSQNIEVVRSIRERMERQATQQKTAGTV